MWLSDNSKAHLEKLRLKHVLLCRAESNVDFRAGLRHAHLFSVGNKIGCKHCKHEKDKRTNMSERWRIESPRWLLLTELATAQSTPMHRVHSVSFREATSKLR